MKDVREQYHVGFRSWVAEHVATPAVEAVGDAKRLGHLGGHLEHLGPVPDDGAETRVLLEPSNRVDAGPATDVEQEVGVIERVARGQYGRDIASPAGERQRQVPGRRLCSIADSIPSRKMNAAPWSAASAPAGRLVRSRSTSSTTPGLSAESPT